MINVVVVRYKGERYRVEKNSENIWRVDGEIRPSFITLAEALEWIFEL